MQAVDGRLTQLRAPAGRGYVAAGTASGHVHLLDPRKQLQVGACGEGGQKGLYKARRSAPGSSTCAQAVVLGQQLQGHAQEGSSGDPAAAAYAYTCGGVAF